MKSIKRGQSTLEYVIVLTAIIAAVLIFAGTALRGNVTNSLTTVGNGMESSMNRINFGGNNAGGGNGG